MKKYYIISKNQFLMIIAVILIIAFVILMLATDGRTTETSSAKRLLPIYCTKQTEKIVSLSFDAAWGNEDTEELIEIMKKYNIKATFFLVGDWVKKYPESVKALSDAGMEIGNHSDTHPNMTELSKSSMIEQLNSCNDKIEAVTGKRPTLFRPPYGAYNNSLIEVMDDVNMKCIQWDVDSLDWKDLSADKIAERVTSKVKEGSIVLFHNAAKHTPEALPSIIDFLLNNGYKIVPISEQLHSGETVIDHEGRQHPA